MPEITNYTIIKECVAYAFKTWLVNILLLLGVAFIFSHGVESFSYVQFVIFIASTFIIHSIVLGLLSYYIIKTNLNHWFKKILLLFIAILIITIFSYLIFGETDFYGDKLYIALACVFSIPTLFTIGLFYPDKLDEELRRRKE